MKWSLAELRKYQESSLSFDITLDLASELKARDRQIKACAPIQVKGTIEVEANDYLLYYKLQTVVTVPSSRSLTPVDLTLDFDVDEIFMTPEQFKNQTSESDEVLIVENQTLDLDDSVIDNILLAIPMQVLTEEEENSDQMPQGTDWQVISEADYLRQKEEKEQSITDPRLADLSHFFESDPEKEE